MRRERERRLKDSDLLETVEEVFDLFTEQHLFHLYRKKILGKLYGVISSGKESRVYWGKTLNGIDVAVKIYLTMTAEFRKSIAKYIIGDPRFEGIPKNDYRKLIYEWARKEFRNLLRMHMQGVKVPKPYAFKGNVIIMEFIGKDGKRAPLVKELVPELEVNPILAKEIYDQTIWNLEKMVCDTRLIHADLSEFNLMFWENKVYIIDVSQSISHEHPMARDFLERDLDNIYRFFSRILRKEDLQEDIIRNKLFSCINSKKMR
ncbi:MAG: serine protein kinase RIO [Desulfurococcales archaeon]|nr:serine protein kinase RIO [Desulfurococcales archaeon]